MHNPKVLFVDDEPAILESLGLLMRPMARSWEMSFAAGGAEALRLMDAGHFDVVVSDMRMPGMDGAQLLAEVARRSPETVRIILSGYADRANAFKAVKQAHQYLSKPCPPAELRCAIAKALNLRGVIQSERLKALVSGLGALPALPDLYQELLGELQSEDPSLKRISEVIERDMGMATSILKLVNSAFFGMPVHVSSIQHALSLLGIDTIKVLVLTIGIFENNSHCCYDGFSMESLCAHGIRVACFCRAIAEVETEDAKRRDDCFVSGLLHDVGKLVLATTLPGPYGEVLGRVRDEGLLLHEAERESFGASHAEVGAYILNLWGFKDAVTEAVCWHHDPTRWDCREFLPLPAVIAADRFDHERSSRGGQDEGETGEASGVSRELIEECVEYWHEGCEQPNGEERRVG